MKSTRINAMRFPRLAVTLSVLLAYVAQSDDGSTTTSIASPAVEQYRFAEGLKKRGFHDLAVAEFEKLVADYPDFDDMPHALYNLQECHRIRGDVDKAIETFHTFNNRYSNHPLAPHLTVKSASFLIERGELDQVKPLLISISKDETVVRSVRRAAIYHLGDIMDRQGDLEAAVKLWSHLTSEQIENGDEYALFARLKMGHAFRKTGDNDRAKIQFLAILGISWAKDELRREALAQMVEISFTERDYVKVIEHAGESVRRYPDSGYRDNAYLRLIWAMFQLERYDEILSFSKSGETIPEDHRDEILYLRGMSYDQLNQYDAAIRTFQDVVDQHPASAYGRLARYAAIETYYKAGRFDECAAWIENASTGDLEEDLAGNAQYYYIRSLIALGRLEDADAALEDLTQRGFESRFPVNELMSALAHARREARDFDRAAALYLTVANDGDADEAPAALVFAAECYASAGDHRAADDCFQRVLNNYPNYRELPRVLIKMAETQFQLENFPGALTHLSDMLTRYPGHSLSLNAQYLRGVVHYRLEQYNQAIADLTACVEHPDCDSRDAARLYLVYAYWGANQISEAMTNFESVLSPEATMTAEISPEFLLDIGDRYLDRYKLSLAERCYEIVAALQESALALRGRLGLGKIEYQRGHLDKAQAILYEIKRETLNQPEIRGVALAYLGDILRRAGDRDQAFLLLEEALKLSVEELKARVMARFGLAELHYQRKEYEPALRYAISVYVLHDDPAYVPDAMAMAIALFVRQGRLIDARKTLDELKNRFPAKLAYFEYQEKYQALFAKIDQLSAPSGK